MRKCVVFGLLLAVSAAPKLLQAQEASRAPSTGSYGLSFRVPEGGGAGFGLRRMFSARTNAGLDVLIDWSWRDSDFAGSPPEDPETSFRIGVVPNVRLYRRISSDVLPFLHVGVAGDYTESPSDAWAWGIGTEVALGAEWFPASNVSLSGAAGMRINYRYSSNGQGSSIRLISIGAFRSELMLNVYF